MPPRRQPDEHSWVLKFRHAFRGIKVGVRGQSSFFVHFFFAAAVVAAGVAFEATRADWCWLAASIAAVLTAELFNTALERLAKAIDHRHNPHLRDALDAGSGAVLLAAIGAATIGLIVLGHRIGAALDWWRP